MCAIARRVYGTMIKGFCVINNDRARSLHADCERVVLLFAEQPYAEGLQLPKQPAAKRQRVDAFTLDLDLAKVQEAEAFDWTQAPLGDSLLVSLDTNQLPPDIRAKGAMGATGAPPQEPLQVPSLLEESGLLDEVFPARVDAPPLAAEPVLSLPEAPGPPGPPGVLETFRADGPSDLLGAGVSDSEMQIQERKQKRRRVRLQPLPGHVFGFDVETQMADAGEQAGHAAGSVAL